MEAGFEVFWCFKAEDGSRSGQFRSWIGALHSASILNTGSSTTPDQSSVDFDLWCIRGELTRDTAINRLRGEGNVDSKSFEIASSAAAKSELRKIFAKHYSSESECEYPSSIINWYDDDGCAKDAACISFEDIGALVLGASRFFCNFSTNKYTSNERAFLSIYPPTTRTCFRRRGRLKNGIWIPFYSSKGGLHVSFVGGEEASVKFGTAVKIYMFSKGYRFPQAPAEYVKFTLE